MTHGNSFLRNSDHAFDAAHHATDHTADHATNHGADRTGRALTNGDALLTSTDDALSLSRERHRNSGNNDDGHCKLCFHKQTPLLCLRFRRTTLRI